MLLLWRSLKNEREREREQLLLFEPLSLLLSLLLSRSLSLGSRSFKKKTKKKEQIFFFATLFFRVSLSSVCLLLAQTTYTRGRDAGNRADDTEDAKKNISRVCDFLFFFLREARPQKTEKNKENHFSKTRYIHTRFETLSLSLSFSIFETKSHLLAFFFLGFVSYRQCYSHPIDTRAREKNKQKE